MKKRKLLFAAAFGLPAGLYLIVLLAARVVPFGSNSLLLWDANHFYAAFLQYWRGALAGRQDFLYSFNRALGQSMAGLASFFLMSPLNLLLLLFPEGDLPLAFTALIVVKIGLCGLTMMVFLQQRYRAGWLGLLFSTSYALMGFVAAYGFHVMWLDALVLLPLVALGVRRMVSGQKPFLYIAALGLTIVCQYYTGYMVCLFAALYFLYLCAHDGAPRFWRRLLAFAGASALAAGLAAVVLLPAVYAVSRGYALFDLSMLTLEPVTSLWGVFTKVYTASASIVQEKSGGPNLYVGIPMLALAVLYFACSAIPLRKRLLSLGFAAVFVFSFLYTAPYILWHAFNAPNFFPARFSFLFSFLLIDLAWQGLEGMTRAKGRGPAVYAAAAAAVFAGLTAVLLSQMQWIEYLAVKTVVMDAVFFCAACLLALWLRKAGRARTAALLLLCGMQAVCLLLNAYYPIVRLNRIWSVTADQYNEQTERGTALTEKIKAGDDGLYRMEFTQHSTDTDPFAYDYFGLTHFSPDADAAAIDFAARLGLRQTYYHICYAAGTTPVLDSLLGVKYVLQTDGVALAPLPDGYEPLWTDGDVTAYENAYALPFAYLAPAQTLSLTDGNPFVNQNTLLSDLTGETVSVFTPVYEIDRAYDGTWETYTFPVKAGRPLYMNSFGTEYLLNGASEPGTRLNGTLLLPEAGEDTTYEVAMTYPLGLHLAYFDLDAFQRAQAVIAAHAARAESDTDSHLVITATVTDDFTQLLLTLPYDEGWQAWVDGERAETASRYGALLAVDLPQGTHTVELRFVPRGLRTGAAVSGISLLLLIAWMAARRRKKG